MAHDSIREDLQVARHLADMDALDPAVTIQARNRMLKSIALSLNVIARILLDETKRGSS